MAGRAETVVLLPVKALATREALDKYNEPKKMIMQEPRPFLDVRLISVDLGAT